MESEDPIWNAIRSEAERLTASEPALRGLADEVVLKRGTLEEALSVRLSRKLAYHATPEGYLRDVFEEAFAGEPSLGHQVRADIHAIKERDPACHTILCPLLFFKGYQAITCYRVANFLWRRERHSLALYLQSLISEVFAVDIHPAARVGCGILLDHATSFVAGETALIEDDVSILHEVTLGGTGKERGDRHPKVRSGVLIGAGAKLLGNIEIGEGAKIGAGSVVLESVPPHSTAVGVPARIIGKNVEPIPSRGMDHHITCQTFAKTE
ncbi:MAG: serine O-acetyltransferase [Opitutales bacterium]